jgi:hypothetical protein
VAAVVGHCVNVESELGVPTVPLITSEFYEQVKTHHALQKGMPGLRVTYLIPPVWGKTAEQIRKDIVGNSPPTGKMIMREIVENLTKPLTAEEKKTGTIEPSSGPTSFTDTPDNLQQMFLENRMTDYMPIILPTEEKVAEMLKGTSHDPDEVVGKMAAHTAMPGDNNVEVFEHWSYTVRTVAINAVMAGARPEYLPVILAVASTGKEGISVSDNSFTEGLIINGPIRDEIGLNYGIGALGPFSQANSTIGRAWNLLSINAGNCGRLDGAFFRRKTPAIASGQGRWIFPGRSRKSSLIRICFSEPWQYSARRSPIISRKKALIRSRSWFSFCLNPPGDREVSPKRKRCLLFPKENSLRGKCRSPGGHRSTSWLPEGRTITTGVTGAWHPVKVS